MGDYSVGCLHYDAAEVERLNREDTSHESSERYIHTCGMEWVSRRFDSIIGYSTVDDVSEELLERSFSYWNKS